MTTEPLPGPVQAELADRLHGNAIRLLRRLRREDRHSGLPGPALSALSVLVYGGPMQHGELAAAEQVRPPTMTRVVHDLVDRGLVRRRVDPEDSRAVILTATAKGRRTLERGRARRVASLEQEIAGLAASRQRDLHRGVEAMTALLRGWTTD